MKYAFIDVERANWPVAVMCRVLRVWPSGYYAWRRRGPSAHAQEDQRLSVLVRESHARSRAIYGSPRVHADLAAKGERTSRKRVVRLMRVADLRGRARRAFVHTTDSKHEQPVADNVLGRDFAATAPNQRWVGDVTYLRTPEGWVYLAVILDLYSRMIVGWAVSPLNDRTLALRALEQAVQRRRPPTGLLHHTDRGSPYASEDYQNALEASGFRGSMSRKGNCWDNAVMESWFNTLKVELGDRYESHADALRKLFDYIEAFYNQQRTHSSLGYVSPAAFERGAVA